MTNAAIPVPSHGIMIGMINKRPIPYRPTACLLLCVLVFTGCAMRFAPAYDEHIVVGLTNANTQAMTLFAAFSIGAQRDQFAAYKDRYDQLIGSLHALEMQIAARPVPATPSRLTSASTRGEVDASGPPVEPIQGMSRTITTMRDIHGANFEKIDTEENISTAGRRRGGVACRCMFAILNSQEVI